MATRDSKVALDGLRDSKKVLLAPFGSKKFSGTLGSDRRFKQDLLDYDRNQEKFWRS